ncbi:MAG: helix-turn-helix transcriptional regulator [Candidatus Nealsonbacteria bacterium]|nr:helix-turn-helix transcriptional regulator [Candidatus Nealsonbacteria bacterium]
MITVTVVSEIREMLAEGRLSQRQIARGLGVSRGTVNAIARGRRPDYAARRSRPSDDFTAPSGPPRRCPECGGLVQMPCLACRVRQLQRCGHLGRCA